MSLFVLAEIGFASVTQAQVFVTSIGSVLDEFQEVWCLG
jgi:hypothetical protein